MIKKLWDKEAELEKQKSFNVSILTEIEQAISKTGKSRVVALKETLSKFQPAMRLSEIAE